MPRNRIAALILLATVALATAAAFAASSPPPPRDQPGISGPDDEGDWRDDDRGPGHRHFHRGDRRGGMRAGRMAFHAAKDPSASVVRDLASLERMYRRSGREAEVAGLYRDVLARTGDPVVRHMAGNRLARLEWRNGNKDAAIEQMKRNLDADLKRLK